MSEENIKIEFICSQCGVICANFDKCPNCGYEPKIKAFDGNVGNTNTKAMNTQGANKPMSEKNLKNNQTKEKKEEIKKLKADLHKSNPQHWWFMFDELHNYDCCIKCGVVRRADKEEKLCRGWVYVELRNNL